jgi:ribosomal protein S18 acetylase RimI-like enzyme
VKDSFAIEPLAASHDRRAFSCGVEALDRYLHTQAGQDARRHISNCFVALPADGKTIAGYYTLAASSIPMSGLAPEMAKKLPRYPVLPAALIGRLAVDRRFKGRSLGAALLYDAIARSLRADPAIFALIVDAKDETAANFYKHFGFMPFASRPLSFFLPMATAGRIVGR